MSALRHLFVGAWTVMDWKSYSNSIFEINLTLYGILEKLVTLIMHCSKTRPNMHKEPIIQTTVTRGNGIKKSDKKVWILEEFGFLVSGILGTHCILKHAIRSV